MDKMDFDIMDFDIMDMILDRVILLFNSMAMQTDKSLNELSRLSCIFSFMFFSGTRHQVVKVANGHSTIVATLVYTYLTRRIEDSHLKYN